MKTFLLWLRPIKIVSKFNMASLCASSLRVEHQLPKLDIRVRVPAGANFFCIFFAL